ncbi:MAG: hypothetical protein ACTSXL_01115 [Alphaproteobacteria bacterium]
MKFVFSVIFLLISVCSVYASTSSYRPYKAGERLDRSRYYHNDRRRVRARNVTKDDCLYQTKTCLDEFCYDEYDGYEKCKNNSITDFYGLVENCMGALPSTNDRVSYQRSCKPFMDSSINDYLKQIKSARRYQTDMNRCDDSRETLDAANACYGIAIARGNAKSKTLKSLLKTACGEKVKGGSELMVEEFWGAGYMGADGAGWLTNFAMLNFASKQHEWQKMVDATLARYIDRKRVECGEGEYTVGEVGKYSAKLVNAGDALRLGVAGAILNKQMQTDQAANAINNIILFDIETPTGNFPGINPAVSLENAQQRLGLCTGSVTAGRGGGELDSLYFNPPTAGDVLIWYQKTQTPKCFVFLVKDPSAGNLEPIDKRLLERMKMANPALTPYYDKCFK